MSDPRFIPRQGDFEGELGRVIEECGEVLQAAGKTLRFGPDCVNPLLPASQQRTNVAWLRGELSDLRSAIDALTLTIREKL